MAGLKWDQVRGVARIFQRVCVGGGGGGCYTVSDIIVMAFSPRNVVGCLLKKRLTKGGGGGHGHPGPPLATPLQVDLHANELRDFDMFAVCFVRPSIPLPN